MDAIAAESMVLMGCWFGCRRMGKAGYKGACQLVLSDPFESNSGGAEGSRTLDLLNAIEALSQLSYSPTPVSNYSKAVLLAQLPPMHYNYRTMRLQTNIAQLLGLALLRRNDL